MKKISQGEYEIFTAKEDAIDKFMQMQGLCREELSGEKAIEFCCSKKGKISITNPSQRDIEYTNSTKLFAEIIERDGKTYVTYYTMFSKFRNVYKLISLVLDIIFNVFAIILVIISSYKKHYFILLIFGLLVLAIQLFKSAKEEKNSPKDSEILVKELEKRVDAVNLWDK